MRILPPRMPSMESVTKVKKLTKLPEMVKNMPCACKSNIMEITLNAHHHQTLRRLNFPPTQSGTVTDGWNVLVLLNAVTT
jgi:hypothetical protein